MKPRLLIFINRLVVGGIANDTIPLAWHLRDEFDILIIYGEKEKDETEALFLLKKYPGLNIKKISSFNKKINLFNDVTAYSLIKKEIRNFKPHIVHTHGAKSGYIGRVAAKALSVPCIIHTFHGHHFHSYYNKIVSTFLVNLERVISRFTTAVITVSELQKKEISEKYKIASKEKVYAIPLGIEMDETIDYISRASSFRKIYCVDADTVSIGIAGRIVPVKNLELFVQVVKKILESSKRRICVFIIGDGISKKNIEDECKSLGISYTEKEGENADVIFTSWIENIFPAMHAMDIVVLTSNNEGTPMSLIEAQLCGKPVVATNVGGVRDILIHSETGYLVEAGDVDGMVVNLNRLIEEDELREQMGKNAASFARLNFSKMTEVSQYRKLYKSILTPKNVQRSSFEKAEMQ